MFLSKYQRILLIFIMQKIQLDYNQLKVTIDLLIQFYYYYCPTKILKPSRNRQLRKLMSLRYQQTYIRNPYVFGASNSIAPAENYHSRNKNKLALKNNYFSDDTKSNKIYQSMSFDKDSSNMNNASILQNNSQVSFARDFKHRLYLADRGEQMKTQLQKINYRKQLQIQIKADKDKKQRQKKELENWQLQRQRKFYKQVGKIQAKTKKQNKQQPSYFVLRSSQKKRSKKNNQSRLNQQNDSRIKQYNQYQSKQPHNKLNLKNQNKIPNINKRGGYHNQSALDSFPQKYKTQQRVQNPQQLSNSNMKMKMSLKQQSQLQIIRQKNYLEQRINSIIRLQQKMMKKLDNFKKQILKTNKQLNLDKEVQIIKNMLKSKPVNLQIINIRDNQIFQNRSDFYMFPSIQTSRFNTHHNENNHSKHDLSRLNQRSSIGINRGINLNQKQYTIQNRKQTQQNNQENGNNNSMINDYQIKQAQQNYNRNQPRKRQIKLFQRNQYNDKNIIGQFQQNNPSQLNQSKQQFSHMPVVNQQYDEYN